MKKPVKPKKPKLQLLSTSKTIIERYYLWDDWDNKKIYAHMAGKENEHECVEEEKDEDGECYRCYDGCSKGQTESISLPALLKIVESLDADIKDIVVGNEAYYRKSNGHIYLDITRYISDEQLEEAVRINNERTRVHKLALFEWPKAVEEYKNQKADWEIYVAQEKLNELKRSR